MRIGTGWERAAGGSSATLGLAAGVGEAPPAVADAEGDEDVEEDATGDGEVAGRLLERRPTVM
jgi:hypothetical protein